MGMQLPPPEQGQGPPPPPPPPSPPSSPPPMSAAPPPPPPPPGFNPTLPPSSAPYAPAGVGELAGFWIRFASLLLDGILYGLVFLVFAIPSFVLGFSAFSDCDWVETTDNSFEAVCPPGSPNGWLIAAAILLAILGYLLVAFVYVRALGRGQTWGMRIAAIKLVRSDNGLPVGFGKALGRTLFAGFVSAQVFYLGYLWAAWDDQKQTWQDKIVSTYVVRA